MCSGDTWMLASEADPRDPCHHCCPLPRPRKPSQELEGTNSRMRVTGCFLPTRAQPDARTPSPATLHPRSAPPGPVAGPFIPSPPSWATSRLQRSGAAPDPAGMRWTAALTLPGHGRTCQPGWLHCDLSPETLSRKRPLQPGLAPRADPTKFQPFLAADQWEGAEMSPGCAHQPPAPILHLAAPLPGVLLVVSPHEGIHGHVAPGAEEPLPARPGHGPQDSWVPTWPPRCHPQQGGDTI